MSSSFLTFWRRQPTKVVTPEELGFSPLFFLNRDCALAATGIGDGYHTQEELREVVQRDMDIWEGSGRDPKKKAVADESKSLLLAMINSEAAKVDYLPRQLRGVDEDLRTRATELMKLAWDVNNGKIDITVIDSLWERYEHDDAAKAEINRIAEHLERYERANPR